MSYGMQRDSRRDHGQWRGCHTFKDILCDGDGNAAARRTTRSGGLKMGKTYYYYYELDGCTETHDPTLPSTSTCPYLPGQRVNMLWVPARGAAAAAASPASLAARRQRSASTSSLRPYEYQTMNPADRFVTPRQAPATPGPSTTPTPTTTTTPAKLKKPAARTKTRNVLVRTSLSAVAVAMTSNTTTTTAAPPPPPPPPPPATAAKLLLQRHHPRHQSPPPPPRDSRAPERAPTPPPTFSTWSPRRLFVRRPSPERSVSSEATYAERSSRSAASADEAASTPLRPPRQQQLVPPSSSSSSASASSSLSRPPLATQGSRSRDISPESLRRFLVDDVPFPERSASRCSSRIDGHGEEAATAAAAAAAVSAPSTLSTLPTLSTACTSQAQAQAQVQHSALSAEADAAAETSEQPPQQPQPLPLRPARGSLDDELDAADDDELNFALLSATSDSAPMTVLSPPPPAPRPSLPLDAAAAAASNSSSSSAANALAEHSDDLCLSAVQTEARQPLGTPLAAAGAHGSSACSPGTGMRGLVDELGWLATAIRGLD